ncbi:hypothetical protein C3L33_10072, partial [Rhododendron williamsianum]
MANTTNLLRSLLLVTLLSSLLVRPSESTVVQRRSAKQTSAVFIGECLYNHNALRASLNLPPLQWSTELANYARWWLNQLRATCAMVHSNSNYGENLFWGQGDGWTAAEAVEAWAAERAYYNYGSNTCMPNMDCTHYTQMMDAPEAIWEKPDSEGNWLADFYGRIQDCSSFKEELRGVKIGLFSILEQELSHRSGDGFRRDSEPG